MEQAKRRGKWPLWGRILAGAAIALAVLAAAFLWYVGDYYRADGTALEALNGTGTVAVQRMEWGWLFDGPGTEDALIFYPGAKVEHTAYAPLMAELAEEGMDCILVEMPFNLAIFGINAADGVMAGCDYPHWYLGGHSLGGAMAASYAASHPEALDGLVLLAAYPTGSLEREGFSVLSVYGSEDTVVDHEKIEAGRAFMPADYREVVVAGGNHAWFGSYGEQAGDSPAAISHEEQWRQTAQAVGLLLRGR